MAMKEKLALLVVFSVLYGCSKYGNASNSGSGGTTHAAPLFSNANVMGGYGFVGTGAQSEGGALPNLDIFANGVFTADGNGKVTSGSLVEVSDTLTNPTVCTFNLSGTYSINADGTGGATITLSPTTGQPPGGAGTACGGGTADFSVALSNAGHNLFLVETSTPGVVNQNSPILEVTATQQ
jgi:hypothetical protein